MKQSPMNNKRLESILINKNFLRNTGREVNTAKK